MPMSSLSLILRSTIGKYPEMPGKAESPQRGRAAAAPAYRIGRRPHRCVGIEHVACKTLEQAGLRGVDTEMAKLYLRLSPRQRGRAYECVWLMVLIHESQNTFTRSGSAGPERNVHRGARRYAHAIPKREHRIENGADGVGQTPSVHHGNGRLNIAPATEETCAISFQLRLAQSLAFDDGVVGYPDFRFGRRAPSPRRQNRADFRNVLGLHEKL